MIKQAKQPYNRNLIAIIVMTGTFVSILNQAVLFTALPHIMHDFQISADTAQWLTSAYMMTNGILIPVTAFLSEKFSTRQLFFGAMGLFIIGTTMAAASNSFIMLLIARIIQASGAGITMPFMQTILFTIFPREKRGFVMGLSGLVIGFAPAIGPTMTGFILNHLSWRYIFIIVLPVAVIILLFAFVYMKNVTEANKGQKIDLPSVVLSTLGFGALLYGTSIASSAGGLSSLIWLLAGAVGVALFIIRELNLDKPMLEFRVFKSHVFTITLIISVLSFITSMGMETILPMYIQNMRGMSALQSGLILLPGAIISGVAAPIAGHIVDRMGGKQVAIISSLITVAATIPFVFLKIDSPLWVVIVFYAIRLIGVSSIMMPVTTIGLNSLPGNLISHGTATNNTFRQVGGSIGIAFLVTVYSGVANHMRKSGAMTNANIAQVHGLDFSFIAVLLFCCIGLVLSFFLKSDKRKPGSKSPDTTMLPGE